MKMDAELMIGTPGAGGVAAESGMSGYRVTSGNWEVLDEEKFGEIKEKNEASTLPLLRKVEKFRRNANRVVSSTKIGRLYLIVMTILSILSTIQYIRSTENLSSDKTQSDKYWEIQLSVFFAVDWCLRLFLSDHRSVFLKSPLSVIDVLTCIPIWTTYHRDYLITQGDVNIDHPKEAIFFILYLLSTTRVLRSYRIASLLHAYCRNAVDEFLVDFGVFVLMMILFFSSAMQFIEFDVQPRSFQTWMYWTVVTISTVGYGDISPISTWGQVAVMAMILFSMIQIPKMFNELIERISVYSFYARARYHLKPGSNHIIICGVMQSVNLSDFFGELFHMDHKDTESLQAVLLLPEDPSSNAEMRSILACDKYKDVLTYLQGSALLDKDLRRAKAHYAQAFLMMANKFSARPDLEDTKTILQNLSIQRYLVSHTKRNQPFPKEQYTYIQLLRSENMRHVASTVSKGKVSLTNSVISLNEIKMGVLAKGLCYPGSTTLITNLFSSVAEIKDQGNLEWLSEYKSGCSWEIYQVDLPAVFVGSKFCTLSFELYKKLGLVLFGLQVKNLADGTEKIVLNPANLIIPSTDQFECSVFVIAQDEDHASKIILVHKKSRVVSLAQSFSKKRETLRSQVSKMASKMFLYSPKSDDNASESSSEADDFNNTFGEGKHLSALMKAVSDHVNVQELIHHTDDAYLKDHYYVLKEPCALEDALIQTSFDDMFPKAAGHLIIVGNSMRNLYDLIRPLRAQYLGSLKRIVILSPDEISVDLWHRISLFADISVVRGSSLSETNLCRAGIFRASKVLILSDGLVGDSNSAADYAVVDAEAIFSYQCIKRLNPKAQVLMEIVSEHNVSYLDPLQNTHGGKFDFRFSRGYAAGHVFPTTFLDSLVCQAYHSPKVLSILQLLAAGSDYRSREESEAQARKHLAERTGLNKDVPPPSLGQTASWGSIKDSLDAPGGHSSGGLFPAVDDSTSKESLNGSDPETFMSSLRSSRLFQIHVPKDLAGKPYGELFETLQSRGQIPIGLLRNKPSERSLPYVFTNPPSSATVGQDDRVFVLSIKPPIAMTRRFLQISQSEKVVAPSEGTIDLGQAANTSQHVHRKLASLESNLHHIMSSLNIPIPQLLPHTPMPPATCGTTYNKGSTESSHRRFSGGSQIQTSNDTACDLNEPVGLDRKELDTTPPALAECTEMYELHSPHMDTGNASSNSRGWQVARDALALTINTKKLSADMRDEAAAFQMVDLYRSMSENPVTLQDIEHIDVVNFGRLDSIAKVRQSKGDTCIVVVPFKVASISAIYNALKHSFLGITPLLYGQTITIETANSGFISDSLNPEIDDDALRYLEKRAAKDRDGQRSVKDNMDMHSNPLNRPRSGMKAGPTSSTDNISAALVGIVEDGSSETFTDNMSPIPLDKMVEESQSNGAET